MSFVLSICFIAEAPEISISYTVYELDQLVGLKKKREKKGLASEGGKELTEASHLKKKNSESKHSFFLV